MSKIVIGNYKSILNQTLIVMENEVSTIELDEPKISLEIKFINDPSKEGPMSGFEIVDNKILIHVFNHNNSLGSMTTKDTVIGKIGEKALIARISTHAIDNTKLFSIFLGVEK